MSTLSVSNIIAANSSANLTLGTANTLASKIVFAANGSSIAIQSNSSTNTLTVNANGLTVNNQLKVFCDANDIPFQVQFNGSSLDNFANSTSIQFYSYLSGTGTGRNAGLSIQGVNDDGYGGEIILSYARGTPGGALANVANGDSISVLGFQGWNNGAFRAASWILGKVDGTPGSSYIKGNMSFCTSDGTNQYPLERMRIDSSGNYFFGAGTTAGFATQTTTNAGNIYFAGNAPYIRIRNVNSTSGRFWYLNVEGGTAPFTIYNDSGTGQYMAYGGTTWIANSDERLKTNLKPITDAINKISTLRTVTGRFKTDEENVSRSFLIAQDVQKVLPEAVTYKDDEIGTLGLGYTDVIPLAIAAIKELSSKLDEANARIAALEAK